MYPNHPTHYQCCGIQITFYEQCGHCFIRNDHHPACLHRSIHPQISPFSLQPFPQPYPKCKDLHRYIQLLSSKCPCCNAPPNIGSWNEALLTFTSGQETLPAEQIFERGVYWLNEMLLAKEEEFQGNLADWEASLKERREVEEAFRIPYLERTFGYDPSGSRGGFMSGVEQSEDKRRLPCGCVHGLKFIRRWFAVLKSCSTCEVKFTLVKMPRREGVKDEEGGYPIWEDDNYSNFI